MKKIFCLIMAVALVFSVSACKKNDNTAQSQDSKTETTFTFCAFDIDGKELCNEEVTTDETTVGAALKNAGLVDGNNEDSSYGLYVTTVCGVSADFEKDGLYWCFYVGDEKSENGVDKTEIEDGQTYTFKLCK